MDIGDILSTDYVAFSKDTTVSKLVGAFEDPECKAVVVTDDGDYEGVVTRRQLSASRHPPDEKIGSLVWRVPKVTPREDVRRVAQLMLDSDSRLLPAFEGERMVGVVKGDDLLRAVEEYLDAVTVEDVYTADLVTASPETTVGKAINELRDDGFTHLPVIDDGRAVGIVSLHDLAEVSARSIRQGQGGSPTGTDSYGGEMSADSGRTHGGFGTREGESARLLDLPVRTVMASPVYTIEPSRTLDEAVGKMLEAGVSSLVVTEDDAPVGIVTKTDALESLTRGAEGNRAIQIYGTDLLDDISYDEILAMVEGFDDRDGSMSVLDAKVHLHEHDEKLRGTSLLLARIRLYTDRGLYVATGEGYGASQAINDARDALERQIRDAKTHGQSKKHPDPEYFEERFGWHLVEE